MLSVLTSYFQSECLKIKKEKLFEQARLTTHERYRRISNIEIRFSAKIRSFLFASLRKFVVSYSLLCQNSYFLIRFSAKICFFLFGPTLAWRVIKKIRSLLFAYLRFFFVYYSLICENYFFIIRLSAKITFLLFASMRKLIFY